MYRSILFLFFLGQTVLAEPGGELHQGRTLDGTVGYQYNNNTFCTQVTDPATGVVVNTCVNTTGPWAGQVCVQSSDGKAWCNQDAVKNLTPEIRTALLSLKQHFQAKTEAQ